MRVSENHRWPVYGTEPHALYSHACVDACTIYILFIPMVLIDIFWILIANTPFFGCVPRWRKRSFWVIIIKSLRTTGLLSHKGDKR